ncbi:uncharacterized protein C8Q71DRAFT_863687 [Rhodofomes roseus]|uniref:Uncharacterized protein n=1 Tax=Rhodofomes roseus TaxID=34475 RepID=A0ABQ8JXT6_9APHY|nr:uncharacterized protein C8Q71DRAFT_863687 [Rhodofomes roseus]KAH9828831.1 hypothetical protein C8Q71DRAFT_863687 [Rhodofomes roseus]
MRSKEPSKANIPSSSDRDPMTHGISQPEASNHDSQVTLVDSETEPTSRSEQRGYRRKASVRAQVSIASHFETGGALDSQTTEMQWMHGWEQQPSQNSDVVHAEDQIARDVSNGLDDDRESVFEGSDEVHQGRSSPASYHGIENDLTDALEAQLEDAKASCVFHRIRAEALNFEVHRLTRALQTAENALEEARLKLKEVVAKYEAAGTERGESDGGRTTLKRAKRGV